MERVVRILAVVVGGALLQVAVVAAPRPAGAEPVDHEETVTVDPRDPAGTLARVPLRAGVTYTLEARGLYRWGVRLWADAECTVAPGDPTWRRETATSPQDLHDLVLVEVLTKTEVAFDWVAAAPDALGCDPGHAYTVRYTPATGGPVRFKVKDFNYLDNAPDTVQPLTVTVIHPVADPEEATRQLPPVTAPELPPTTVPGGDTPPTTVPGGDTPPATVPGGDTPPTTVPGGDTPPTTVPGGDTPPTTVPGVDPGPIGRALEEALEELRRMTDPDPEPPPDPEPTPDPDPKPEREPQPQPQPQPQPTSEPEPRTASGGGSSEPTSSVRVRKAKAKECDRGQKTMTFTVKRLGDTSSDARVDYRTVNGTAKAGRDFVATRGTLAFAPGETVKKVPVRIVCDRRPERTERFFLELGNASGVSIATERTAGVITDNDRPRRRR